MFAWTIKRYKNHVCNLMFQDERHISNGESFTTVARACYNMNPDQLIAVGVNCIRPLMVSPLIETLKTENIPLVVYPNSGERWDAVNAR